MNLTKDLLRRIRTKIQEELSKVEEELNITLTLGNCSYSSNRAKFQLELLTANGKSKEQEDPKLWITYAHRQDIKLRTRIRPTKRRHT